MYYIDDSADQPDKCLRMVMSDSATMGRTGPYTGVKITVSQTSCAESPESGMRR